jgi:hypothetical protein
MKTYFHRYWEAPADGGGADEGGATTVEDDPGPGTGISDVFSDPTRWDEPAGTEPDPTPEPAATEPEPEPEPAEKPEDWSDEDWGAFQKQFPKGTPADLWKHYSALRTQFSRGEQHQPAPEPDPEPEPEETPASWLAHQYQSLGPIPTDGLSVQQRTELADLMQQDPKAAANWAAANSHLLTEEEFSAIQSNWYQADPYGAQRAWASARDDYARQQQFEELAPRLAVVDAAQQVQGRDLAFQQMPIMLEQRDAFGKWIEDNPEVDEQLSQMTDPQQIAQSLQVVFSNWYMPQLMAQQAQAAADATAAAEAAEAERVAAEEAAAAQQRRGRTATRTAPATPSGGSPTDDDIRAAIRNATR